MKHLAIAAFMFHLCAVSAYAQQRPVKMTFSGSMVPTSLTVQPNTVTDEDLLTIAATDGGALCVDLDHFVGHLTETYQVTGAHTGPNS